MITDDTNVGRVTVLGFRVSFRILILALGLCSVSCQTTEKKPHILIVVLDTVRADRNLIYGYERDTTPNLTRIARDGVVFDNAWAPAAWTWPSHASLFTGEPPWKHGAVSAKADSPTSMSAGNFTIEPLRSDLPTLAEELNELGYSTICVSTNSLLSPELGLTRGFDQVETHKADRDTINSASRLLAKHDSSSEPVFMVVNLLSAHAPWTTTPAEWSKRHSNRLKEDGCPEWACPFIENSTLNLYDAPNGPAGLYHFMAGALEIDREGLELIGDLYDGQLSLVDHHLGKMESLWRRFAPQGALVIVSDHGEHLGERRLMDHGHTVYPEETKIPMVVSWPGTVQPGRVSTGVMLQDLTWTALEWAGRESSRFTLDDAIKGQARPEPIQASNFVNHGAAKLMRDAGSSTSPLTQGWWLHIEDNFAMVAGHEHTKELYDLKSDPSMRVNVSAQHADKVTKLEQRLPKPPSPTQISGPTPDIPEDVTERLRALGYVAD